MSPQRIYLQLFLLHCREKRSLLLQLSVRLLSLLLRLQAHLVDIILKTLRLELELVVFSLKDSLTRPFLFYLLGMLDEQVILLHLSQVSLLSDFDELSIQIRDATFAFVDVSPQFADLLLVSALFQLQVQGVILFA